MPKFKQVANVVCYDKENNYVGLFKITAETWEEVLHEYQTFVSLVITSQFSFVRRADLVSGNHTLFVCADVRTKVKQLQEFIPLKP